MLIDAKLPLLKAIVEWAERTRNMRWREQAHSKPKQLYFDTSNREYFRTVKSNLAGFGWEVLDGGYHTAAQYADVPVIVYDNSTAATVNTCRSLLSKMNVPPRMLCALLDQYEGQGDLNRLTRELRCEGQVSSVCSAVIYDYLFQAVRLLVRCGNDEASIQKFLDQELLKIGDEAETR